MSLFSRARRVLRRLLDAASDRAREGPDLPLRFADEARLFLILNPAATPIEWETFALSLARAAYRDAFGRGVDLAFRERDPELPLLHPDAAEERARSLRDVAAHRAFLDGEADALAGVPLAERSIAAARLGAMLGHFRTVVVEPDRKP